MAAISTTVKTNLENSVVSNYEKLLCYAAVGKDTTHMETAAAEMFLAKRWLDESTDEVVVNSIIVKYGGTVA